MPQKPPRTLPKSLAAILFLLATGAAAQATPQADSTRTQKPAGGRGVEIVQEGGYPELRVDGAPFFLHSATFFYFRIPRDLWERSLDRHRELGINTIDLHIPWNWHEPREDDWDFDGHSNPRRDLRTLLRLIAEKGFKLIVRPGPVIGDDWRHAGYPDWLLARPEYKMDAEARLEGRYPPLVELAARDPEAAARGWLANPEHIERTRTWLARVAQELAPYSARRTLTVQVPKEKGEGSQTQVIAGPLLFVQLGGETAGGGNGFGPAARRYIGELRAMLEAAGLEGPFCVDLGEMDAVPVRPHRDTVETDPMGAMAEWFLHPLATQSDATPGERMLHPQDISELEFSVNVLRMQPAFPPILIGYQAGWHAPTDDSRAFESWPANTLLSSRLLLAHGARGLNYLPAQDALTPAGYDMPSANRHYRWDAALDLSGNLRPRARALKRTASMLNQWGELLATSHPRADFGFVLPSGASRGQDALRRSRAAKQLERVADLAGFACELLDPEQQPVEQFLREAVVLLPAFDGVPMESNQEKPLLSEKAQGVLIEYVRRGGTLVYFPPHPPGTMLEELWAATRAGGSFGSGRVIEAAKEFYTWVQFEESFAQTRARAEAAQAVPALRDLLKSAGVRPAIQRASGEPASGELAVTQLVSDAGTGLLGARSGGQGLLSVTNLSLDEPAEETIEALSPAASARGTGRDYLRLSLLVPPRESLLLPLRYPLCSAAPAGQPCKDEVVTAGAELLSVARDAKTLELTFYAPARASVLLRLEREPGRVSLDEFRLEASWSQQDQLLTVSLARGAWPNFVRVLKIALPYSPWVPEKTKERKQNRTDFDYGVADAVRLPLGDDAWLPSDPPLVIVDQDHNGQMLVEGSNYGELARGLDFKIEGPIRGDGGMALAPNETRQTRITLRASKEQEGAEPGPSGLLQGQMEVKSGHDRRHSPILFAVVPEEGMTAYQFDFDRDGSNEWVLENSGMRMIVSPEAGGRAVALFDKVGGASLLTSVGGMLDEFEGPGEPSAARVRTFNRPYRAEWVKEEKSTALRLTYTLPDRALSGATIEKTVRLSGTDSLQVDYQVRLAAGSDASGPPARYHWVAANSIPALLREENSTRFCWQAERPASPQHCERFAPGEKAIPLPEGARRLEIQTPGRLGMALEWDAGRMTIEMKNFSAMLRLEFPSLAPGADAQKYQVRYRALAAE